MKLEIDSEKATDGELEATINFLSALREEKFPREDIVTEPVLTELSDAEVDNVVQKMHTLALAHEKGESFKATLFYRVATKNNWNDLSPNTRKAIGRRFKKMTDEYREEADKGKLVIEFKERNAQNMAMYQVLTKMA